MNEELLNYKKHINFNNKIIYDIGANEGVMTDFFIKNSNNSKIISLEPHQNNIELLTKKFNKIDNVKVIHGALNTHTGTCNIGYEEQQRTNGLKQGHVLLDEKDFQRREWEIKKNNVKCFRLDDFCKNANIIKMDIEGFEHKILYGSLENINVDTLLLEIHSWEDLNIHGWDMKSYQLKHDSLHKMVNYLMDIKYTKFILAKRRNDLTKIDRNTTWKNVPLSSYMRDGKRVYYKVVNLIIKK